MDRKEFDKITSFLKGETCYPKQMKKSRIACLKHQSKIIEEYNKTSIRRRKI
jgi:hypothetical protein